MNHDFANSSLTPRILVVEDDPIIRTIHQQVLASLGCQVDCVSRGQAAIRQLHCLIWAYRTFLGEMS